MPLSYGSHVQYIAPRHGTPPVAEEAAYRPERPQSPAPALITAVGELAKARGLSNPRVAYKLNARGEHVVAVIFTGFDRE